MVPWGAKPPRRLESTLLGLLRPSPSWLIDRAKVRQIPVETPLITQKKIPPPSGIPRYWVIYLHHNQST